MTENITIDDISHFLINNKYQLTALEFDFELIERGFENKYLRNFFTNPENFENVTNHSELPTNRIKASPSVSTIDSIDFAKYSDDGMQLSDERIKVLEFELRKKNEEVRKLREELTFMSTSKTNKSFVVDWIPDSAAFNQDYETDSNEPLMAHENRALNFLINEYLLQRGFKLTAVSFSEEITDQDLDMWDDVGLNIPKLPNLECFIRAKRLLVEENIPKSNSKSHVYFDSEAQTDPMDHDQLNLYIETNRLLQETVDSLKIEIGKLNMKSEKFSSQLKDQTEQIIHLKKELNDSKSKLICAQRDLMYESAKKKVTNIGNQSTSGDTDLKSETISNFSDGLNEAANSDSHSSKDQQVFANQNKFEQVIPDDAVAIGNMFEEIVTRRNTTLAFSTSLRLFDDDDQNEDQKLVTLVDTLDQFVSLLSDVIPSLFEATNKKDDSNLTMLLVQCTCLHPDSKIREKLLKFLINLHPDPSVAERVMIMKQIQILSGYLGAFRVESELITQIWEMMYEKPKPNANKRILLANICGIVCPLAPSNLRSSLILSIHQQMLEEENDPKVIPHILSSIASMVPCLEDIDKIPHLIHIAEKYLWKHEPTTSNRKNSVDNEMTAGDVVKYKLFPAVAQWCLDAGVLHTSLVHEILLSMKTLSLTVNNINFYQISLHLNAIQLLVPFIDVWVKMSTPQILDDASSDDSSIPISHFETGKTMELYRVEYIVNRDKYNKLHQSFLNYTGINLPKSLVAGHSESIADHNETIQCWTPWLELKWVQVELIPNLINILLNIQPKIAKVDLTDVHVMSDLAKNQFTATPLKSREVCIRIGTILYDLGCRVSVPVISNVIIPCFSRYLFESSNKGVDCDLSSETVSTGLVSGYCALLAAIVHLEKSHLATDNLKKFLTNISFLVAAESLSCDGIKLTIDVLSSGVGNINTSSDIILSSLQPCIACPNVPVRLFVCLMLQELVIQLSNLQHADDTIFIRILDSLKNLIDCPYEVVKVMSVGPLVSLVQAKAITPGTRKQVFDCLAELMNESVNFKSESSERAISTTPCTEILITALIQMINVVGPTSPESFKDEAILPWLLGITEINNGTSDTARRSGIAMILYSTFSTLSYYLESSSSLETCLLPALDRLRLDMLELYPENVKEVESMSQDIRKRIEVKQKSSSFDSTGNMKSKIAGLNFMSRTANATSNATSSLFGKFKDLKDSNSGPRSDDSSDQGSVTKSNITNFFSKRR